MTAPARHARSDYLELCRTRELFQYTKEKGTMISRSVLDGGLVRGTGAASSTLFWHFALVCFVILLELNRDIIAE